MTTTRNRFQGSLLGVRIGDALGMPFEILTPEQIEKITGVGGVVTFWDPQQHRTDAPEWAQKLKALRPGECTDDWQLTMAGALSLVDCSRLYLPSLAAAYTVEMRRSDLGWGGTTKASVRELECWFNTNGQDGRSPDQFAPFPKNAKRGYGCGNGVAMRIAPFGLALCRIYDPQGRMPPRALEPFQEFIWKVGGLTHPDPRATIAAFAVASLIARLASHDGDPLTREELMAFMGDLLYQTIYMENKLGNRVRMPIRTQNFSERLARVKPVVEAGLDAREIRERLGTSSFALESVPFALATFLRHPTDFRAALKEAVEAGGDTDTNAAIVGSLVGANVGVDGIPMPWRRFRHDFEVPVLLGTRLYRASAGITRSVIAHRPKELP